MRCIAYMISCFQALIHDAPAKKTAAFALPFRQLRKQDAEQDQDAANDGFDCERLMQKDNAQDRRHHRIQGAEHSRTLGGGAWKRVLYLTIRESGGIL